jgi:hypothetical protein
MAASVAVDAQPHPGKSVPDAYYVVFGTINLGAAYTTNGVVVTPQLFGLTQLVHVDLTQAAGRVYEFDKANLKIKAYRNAAGAGDLAEVANATDLSAANVRFMAYGK